MCHRLLIVELSEKIIALACLEGVRTVNSLHNGKIIAKALFSINGRSKK
jgi:hypothetical protein